LQSPHAGIVASNEIDVPLSPRVALGRFARARVRSNELRAGTAEEAVAAALRAMTAHYRACARRALSAIADRVGSDD
jgi:hypothetical protein